jgi:hypothetical protein
MQDQLHLAHVSPALRGNRRRTSARRLLGGSLVLAAIALACSPSLASPMAIPQRASYPASNPDATADLAEASAPTELEPNATIGGSAGAKNIHSGPGTQYDELHIAYPGDRVMVSDSTFGTDGEIWHKVYYAKYDTEGWLPGFLLNLD